MNEQELRQALRRFPREREMLLPALQYAQDQIGYLPGWAMVAIGVWLRVPKSEVYGAATSYANLRFTPLPRHYVRVCCGASCRVNGSASLLRRLEESLGPHGSQTSPGGNNISLEKSDCLFACGVAPVVEVDGVVRGRTTEGSLLKLLSELTEGH